MPEQPETAPTPVRRHSGDRLLVAGAALVGVGFLATLVTLLPLLTGGDPLPVGFYLAASLAPVGLGLILVALWQRSRARRKRLRSLDVADATTPTQRGAI